MEEAMTTPVMMPVIWVMLQLYPGGGSAVPTPRVGNTNLMATYLTKELCERDKANHPGAVEDYVCVEYKTDRFIDYTFPKDTSGKHGGLDRVPIVAQAPQPASARVEISTVGPTDLLPADRPYLEPREEQPPADNGVVDTLQAKDAPAVERPEQPKPKKVAARQRPPERVARYPASGEQQQQIFDPLGAIVSLLTPRDW
jgi:hypothetical protein